jgi:2-polyprenyl-6-methoxyphenol hydroxylase-like FAD-dependent oxidoreductase
MSTAGNVGQRRISMQFYLNGFTSGNPDLSPARTAKQQTDEIPQEADVLIVGCGPAGLTLAAQLAAFPNIKTCITEQKLGPLDIGQADGVACRTLEMFNAFGFAERVLREAYWVNETTFWKPAEAPQEGIVRSGRIKDTEPGLSEFPHVILNQARVHEFFLDVMRDSAAGIQPYYGLRFLDVKIATGDSKYPVTATFERLGAQRGSEVATVRARYMVGCDGARSAVRRSIGQTLKGDSANQAWGVMDVLAVTDFPDVRVKAVINSAEHGTIVLIPREGGYLIRIYVEMDELEAGERVAGRTIGINEVIAATRRVLHPYTLEVKQVAWWSVYEIGQRLCDRFDDVGVQSEPRVFIAGDACHTHSPKAGQGMNVSMQDAFNLGWKLASVIQGTCTPQLLRTYDQERQAVAKELIEFDRKWASMLSAPLKSANNLNGVDPADVKNYFIRSGRYTAGTATCYRLSTITGPSVYQHLARGFPVGRRFHSAPVLRLCDAKPMQLGHAATADGRWRLFVFADIEDPRAANSRLAALCEVLAHSPSSPVMRYTAEGLDIDATFDVRGIFQQAHHELDPEGMPDILLPRKGQFGLKDYEKVFCPDFESGQDVFEMRGVDRHSGCVVIVRPDQYVAHILPLEAYAELSDFFAGFMIRQR